MDLDWCETEDLKNGVVFNQDSIIVSKENKKILEKNDFNDTDNELNMDGCFNINYEPMDSKKLLLILNYLSIISNYLRTFIRNKSPKYTEIKEVNEEDWKHQEIKLKPKSTNSEFKDLILKEEDSVTMKVIGIFKGVI